jgi:hypothetical protein
MASFPSLRRRAYIHQNTLPYRGGNPDATQRLVTPKYRDEHYQASSDYVYGLQNRKLETPALSLDEYLDLLHEFSKMAQTFNLPEPKKGGNLPLLPTFEELEELVDLIDEPQFEEEGL